MGHIAHMTTVLNKYLYLSRMFMLHSKIRDVVGDGTQLLDVSFIRSMIACKYMQLYQKLKHCIVFEKIFKEDVRPSCTWHVRTKMLTCIEQACFCRLNLLSTNFYKIKNYEVLHGFYVCKLRSKTVQCLFNHLDSIVPF